MRPHMCLLILMDSNGSLWVLIGPFSSFCVLIGHYSSFYVRMDSIVSLGALYILICSYGF